MESFGALMRRRPTDEETLEVLLSLGDQEDRTAAIVCGTILEDRLRRTLIRFLKYNLSEEEHEELFGDSGSAPLSSFDAKIRLSVAFGIFNNATRSDFDKIGKIRNLFAHQIIRQRFDDDAIKGACDNLHIIQRNELPELSQIAGTATPKHRYIMAVSLYHWMLTAHFPKWPF
jgi:DNA-binding MltR family transcriptional regulator